MKKSLLILLLASFFLMGLTLGRKKSDSIIPEKKMTQVGIIVDDIEKSAAAWAELFGLEEVPSISVAAGHESKPTSFRGKPSDATAKLAFFQLDNITIELIEPDGTPSTWQEFLDNNGPGIHHIAFHVDDMKTSVRQFEKFGVPEVQSGGWGTGEYAYMDGSAKLALIIELLENY
ncbi:MAG: VOC family protein [Bacteroidales bacterium]|nr:VOC family protein [Bacteroidales bacterium]